MHKTRWCKKNRKAKNRTNRSNRKRLRQTLEPQWGKRAYYEEYNVFDVRCTKQSSEYRPWQHKRAHKQRAGARPKGLHLPPRYRIQGERKRTK